MQKKKDDEIASARTLQASKKPFRGMTIHGGSAPLLEIGTVSGAIKEGTTIVKTQQDYYEVGKLIGQGGMGTVYKATHILTDKKGKPRVKQQVAIKEILFNEDYVRAEPGRTIHRKKELVEKFLTEIELIAKLDHPNIVRILDFDDKEDGNAYYVMEYLEGKDLDSLLSHGPMNWHKTSRLVFQVCSALEAAHEYQEEGERRPIVHRDIKPMNIFITVDSGGSQRVKVLDFGLARINTPKPDGQPQKEDIDGTPDYMSPEQARGDEVDPRNDIYSIGVVIYQMLTGQTPFTYFPEKSEADFPTKSEYRKYSLDVWNAFWTKVYFETPQAPSTFNQGIPKEVDALILRCLEKDPAKRFQSIRELREAIKATGSSAAATSEISGVTSGSIDASEGTDAVKPKKSSAEMNGDRVLVSPSLLPKIQALMPPSGDAISGTKNAWGASAPPQAKSPKRLRRWLAIGAISVASVGAGSAIYLSRTHPKDPLHDSIAVNQSPQKKDPVVPSIDAAPLDAAPKQDSATELTANRSLTFKTGLKGVDVLIDGMSVCTTDQTGSCSFSTSESSQPLTVRLEKKGYVLKELPVVPDSDKVVDVELERERKAKPPPQRIPKPGKQPGTKPSITSEE
jgi:serine/threonine protein kinase